MYKAHHTYKTAQHMAHISIVATVIGMVVAILGMFYGDNTSSIVFIGLFSVVILISISAAFAAAVSDHMYYQLRNI